MGAVTKAAEAAGASPESLAALRQDAEQRRSAGGRLDAARAKAARAARVAEEARSAASSAAQRASDAEAAAQAATKELAEVEASVSAASATACASPQNLVESVRIFLDALEQAPVAGVVGKGPCLPERALEAMAALRRRIDGITEAARPADGTEESDDERSADGGSHGTEQADGDVPVDADQDTLMGALDSAEDDDDAAMLAIARPRRS